MKRLSAVLLMVGLLAAVSSWLGRRAGQPAAPTAVRMTAGPGDPGFARATEPRPFRLPLDHGPHFAYQTEWWYYTGNLQTERGRHFGYQLTFFRRGLTPGPPPAGGGLATNQVYFAHFAITDAGGSAHHFSERFSRGAAGLAGASGEPFRVWLEDWRADATNEDGSAVRLQAKDEGGARLDLSLQARKPVVPQGDRGLSPKSDEPGNASYYLSYTRLAARGEIDVGGETHSVAGEGWFDHEWSTSALGPDAVGWDWWSLQLGDDRELMFFRIRRKDGTMEPVSGGTLVEPDGRARRLAAGDVTVEVLDRWRSPDTDAQYPSRWRLAVPSAAIELSVEPWLAGQEIHKSFTYWEGAVRLAGTSRGRPVAGNGYVELTGYARGMQGVF